MGFSSQEYWSGLHFLLQGIFPSWGQNLSLPHCRQTLSCEPPCRTIHPLHLLCAPPLCVPQNSRPWLSAADRTGSWVLPFLLLVLLVRGGVASLPRCALGSGRSLARGVLALVPSQGPGLAFPVCCRLPHLIENRKSRILCFFPGAGEKVGGGLFLLFHGSFVPGLLRVLIGTSLEGSAGRWV